MTESTPSLQQEQFSQGMDLDDPMNFPLARLCVDAFHFQYIASTLNIHAAQSAYPHLNKLSQEKIDWYNKINLANEQELLIAIPYFARKLKNIALYYMKLRKKLQRAKIDYSTVGTKTAIEQQVYRYFLELFSPDGEPDLVFENQPNFSDLQQTLRISVQELYDDHVYLDRDPRVDISSYYNVLDQATASFFATKGITISLS